MRTQNRTFRLIASLAIGGLLFAQMPPPAVAQPVPPPPATQQGDPPTRVGRLARMTGTVSFHSQDETDWAPAVLNYPVTAGSSFWTQPGAQASIEVSASRVVMAPQTELDVSNLTDATFLGTVPQGEVYLHVQAATPDEAYAVQTPRGLVTLSSPGRYGIAAGDTQDPTLVTVIQGSAHIEGPGVTMDVAANQTATIIGADSFQASVAPARPDAFLTAMLNAERPPAAAPPPPAVASMPGGDDLSQYGTWTDTSDYGQVWYPQVASDWVPYREGQWAYVEPWGWTWVDSDPWGFAPFHYGRWAEIGGRWGWVPGAPVAGPPVYAPALVAFFGVGAVVGVGIGAALAAGRVGWCPLGPREAYQPWYRSSPAYLRKVNIRHVTNFTTINRNVTVNNFSNRGAATVVPTSAMTSSRPVGRFAQRVDPAQLAQARPLVGTQPVHPIASTIGVTPGVAHQFNLPTPTAGRPVAPGPAFRTTPATAHPVAPPLHNPGQNAVPAAAAIHPVVPNGSPALRPPPEAGHVGPPPIERAAPVVAPGAVPHTGQFPNAAERPVTPVQPVAPQLRATPAAPGAIQPQHLAPATPSQPVVPQVHAMPAAPGAIQPQHIAPVTQAPVVHAPPAAPAPLVAHTPPPAAIHAPEPQVHAAPVVQAPPPVFHAAPPPPVVHAAPPPQIQHVAPPPQMVRAAPPPAVVHAPPPQPAPHPAPAPAQGEHKKPGQP
jgi:hypothetical protein